ncbi:MAG TPA: hypothetical protein VD902_03180 [Symbiobacteriaceae bacterium]|nr:hypothetical protein [Symbiobacteriaceae bacterium]
MKILLYIVGTIIAIHGAIHLLGFVAYFPLAKIAELPYKTTLAGGRWDVGPAGTRIYALLWLIVALGFLIAVAGLFAGQSWWRPAMVSTIVLSTALIALDWAPSFRGAVVNAAILVLMGINYFVPIGE